MIQVTFTPEEIQVFQHERYHHPHPHVQRKMEVLWLKSQGLCHQKIARLAHISINTVTHYLREYKEGGIERIKKVHFYRPQSLLCEHISTLEPHFTAHPPATLKEAAEAIERLTGIRRSETQVRIFLRKAGLRRRKVGMIPARGDPIVQDLFKKKSLNRV